MLHLPNEIFCVSLEWEGCERQTWRIGMRMVWAQGCVTEEFFR